jgi:hypothetical protein
MIRPYEMTEEEYLRVLLAKSELWRYEQEFRLIAQERANATPGEDTLMTDGSYLQLPDGALTATSTRRRSMLRSGEL